MIDALGLHAASSVGLARGLGYPIVEDVAQPVRREVQGRVAGEQRDLSRETLGHVEITADHVVGDLTLIFVQLFAGIVGLAVDG